MDAATRARVDQAVAAALDLAKQLVDQYPEEPDPAMVATLMEYDLMAGIRAHVLTGNLEEADKVIRSIVTGYSIFAVRHVRGTEW